MKKNNLNAYDVKPEAYFDGARHDILDFLKSYRDLSILEIGCGSGETGELALQRGIAREYDAIELNAEAAQKAKLKLSNVFCEDVEGFQFDVMSKKYNCIIMSEVLEHLHYPWELLAKISKTLQINGFIFASSPNICSYQIIVNLIAGKFEYSQSGVMDKTHLRWFTPKSYEKMFLDVGFTTISVGPITKIGTKASLLNLLTAKKFQHLWHNQIMYIGSYSGKED